MQTHYGFTDQQIKTLAKSGVGVKELYSVVKLFDPDETGEPISQINLYYYIDTKGNFNDPPANSHKKIALEIFNNLSNREKMNVLKYLEDLDNNFEDEEDEEISHCAKNIVLGNLKNCL
jgi:hypothetical protein